jgi:propanediol utilization protein
MSASPVAGAIDRERVERLVAQIVRDRLGPSPNSTTRSPLVVNVSVRHMHITQEDLETVFGPGAELTPLRWLYQEGEFAAEQSVDLIGPKRRMLHDVRILGPTRAHTQVELAFSDAIALGIDVPVRMSGNIDGTPGCIVMGPKGHLVLDKGVIRAQRHVHMSPADADHYGVQAGEMVDLVVEHPTCPLTICGIVVRVAPRYKLEVHIDTDEGNACDVSGATALRLVKSDGRCETG